VIFIQDLQRLTARGSLNVFYAKQYEEAKRLSFSDWLVQSNYINPNNVHETVSETRISQCDNLRSRDGNIHIKQIFQMDKMDGIIDYLNMITNNEYNLTNMTTANRSRKLKPYRDEYNDNSKRFIEKYYAKDIERFDFKF